VDVGRVLSNFDLFFDKEERVKNIKLFLLISGFLLLVGVWLSLPDGKARLIFCDVGQGDGVLLSRGTFQMLYDVGPDNGKMRKCLERYVPFWDRKIEIVILSHWDKDHVGGLVDIGKSYKLEKVFSGVEAGGEFEQKTYAEILRQNDVLRGDWFDFEVVWPARSHSASAMTGRPERMEQDEWDSNEMSLVGILNVSDKKILLMGDASVAVEQRLVWRKVLQRRIGKDGVDVLKVGHHGSNTSTSEELLEAVLPKVGVIGVGRNSFGHPTKEVLKRLEKFGVEVKRTDEDGDVVMVL